jgi:two-component system, NarL family, invasion response regulator UvrY
MTRRIGTLIVDDQPDIRALFRLMLDRRDGELEVVGEAACGEDALALVETLHPTVIVLDEMMPGLSGIQTAERILARRPEQRILLCSACSDARLRERAQAAGVTAYLSKDDITDLPEAVRAAARA